MAYNIATYSIKTSLNDQVLLNQTLPITRMPSSSNPETSISKNMSRAIGPRMMLMLGWFGCISIYVEQ